VRVIPFRWNEPACRARRLVRAGMTRPGAPLLDPAARLLVVDVERQRLALIEGETLVAEVPVSTAAAGIGGQDGSHRTPPGWHRIHARVGDGEPAGRVFESRLPTARVWEGGEDGADLILGRVLTLEGLEDGVNRGPGCDSLARYIYLHGTNHAELLGRPASHGCVRLSVADVVALFDRVREGDPVLIAGEPEAPPIPDPAGTGRFHYAGIGGSGMSALAQFQAMRGGRASGSDRSFDRGERADARAKLEALGITVLPQDGSGLGEAHGAAATLVVSTAVEAQVPDVAAARARGVPVIHRSELLAHFVARHRTVAVSGTSGKSTVVAMIFEILRGAGAAPSVITGGDLLALEREGLWGNAWAGRSDLLVVEADESDGSLVRYAPAVGVVLNLQRDHKPESEVAAMFTTFAARTREGLVVGEARNLDGLADGALVFGFGTDAAVRGEGVELDPLGSRFTALGTRFALPVPGRHNVENALAAIAACAALGVVPAAMVEPLARFQGVGRRFQSLGRAGGVEVVDDFAHNPAKIEAALATAHARGRRVLAVYQPHGYGPTRFLRDGFVASFTTALGSGDRLWMLEVFYAGGSAQRDFSAADIVAEIAAAGIAAEFAPTRERLVERVVEEARSGDLVLVMGARDPSLTAVARAILAGLGTRAGWP
jgi:UDP-N-acetylmuramate--alanine ligase